MNQSHTVLMQNSSLEHIFPSGCHQYFGGSCKKIVCEESAKTRKSNAEKK